MKQSVIEKLKRVPLLVLGLFILALGVGLSTKSGLGVSPTASLAYVLSQIFPLSMGTFTTLINVVYALIQVLILRRNYHPSRLLQLAVVFLFGYFTDFALKLVSPIEVTGYPLRLALCVVACAVMGFGIFLEVKANVIVMASEGAISAVAAATGKEFGQIKIINDLTCVALSLIISLIALRAVVGIREGTVIAALLVGTFTQLYNRHIHLFDRKTAAEDAEPEVTGDRWARDFPLVITIEREFGSGGHAIGKALAEKLGIKYYDYELIEKTAEESGLPADRVQKHEERIRTLFYALYNQTYAYTSEMSAQDAIFEAQRKVIRRLASQESCVIMGRLGGFILRNRPNSLHIFISAKEEYRAARIAEEYRLSPEKALEAVRAADALHHSYARHFTGQPWGMARHYRMCLDTSAFGIDETLKLILDAVPQFRSMFIGGDDYVPSKE
ncbi:MAG: cytidylate kinase family protein [Oscillospiraceae bacterium]|nr:cytidylate kinase family protein [Oscillospiraceae bacterium]